MALVSMEVFGLVQAVSVVEVEDLVVSAAGCLVEEERVADGDLVISVWLLVIGLLVISI